MADNMAIQTDRAFTEQYIYTTMDVNCQEDILFRRPFIPYNGKRFFIKQTLGSGGIPGLYIYIYCYSLLNFGVRLGLLFGMSSIV